jgi:hypothetical protein
MPGGPIIVIEVDGATTRDRFHEFSLATRVPRPLKTASTRFAMRTVVSVAPRRQQISDWMTAADFTIESVERLDGTPFLLAFAHVPTDS